MSIITLTTDLGTKDHSVGSVKGAILKNYANATIIDINNDIKAFDLINGAYFLKNAFPHFPDNTIHLFSINSLNDKLNKFLLIKYKHHYFIGADNGVYSYIIEDKPDSIIDITNTVTHSIFPLRDIFVPAACKLLSGIPPEEIGNPINNFSQRPIRMPFVEGNIIRGQIIQIDVYGNAILDITKKLIEQNSQNRKFIIHLKKNYFINHISNNYHDVPLGEMLAIYNTSGFLQISINQGEANDTLGLHVGEYVQIEFL